jgi:uncharacterized protein (DUF4415 family)/uncharacterized DUF497 family protein
VPPGDRWDGGADGTSEEFEELFANVQIFDWNPNKRDQTFRERHIAFEDARITFQGPITIRRSDRKGEVRYMVFGYLGDVEIVLCARSEATFVGSYRPGERVAMKEKNITIVPREAPRKIKSDLNKLRNLSDAEIEASIANDPDWSDDWNWSEAVLVIPPKKKAISIRVDEDVLDYFKKEGAGYQRRINAVLRSYMQQKRKKRA